MQYRIIERLDKQGWGIYVDAKDEVQKEWTPIFVCTNVQSAERFLREIKNKTRNVLGWKTLPIEPDLETI